MVVGGLYGYGRFRTVWVGLLLLAIAFYGPFTFLLLTTHGRAFHASQGFFATGDCGMGGDVGANGAVFVSNRRGEYAAEAGGNDPAPPYAPPYLI